MGANACEKKKKSPNWKNILKVKKKKKNILVEW